MYPFQKIEKKWQRKWQREGIYKTESFSQKPKFYVLDMFPYPSGEGLHVGHLKGYIATDIVARMKMMQGFNVLHPMGWDAFGLPAENYALEKKIHPQIAIRENIKRFKEQLKKVGFSYDWSREINTTDPKYYKWTQWIFLQMFKKGLVFRSFEPINWCPSCQTGLANEDLEDGKCERCGSEIERRPIPQWVLKITNYAERLLKDLKLVDWEKEIVEMQKNWIGKSEGWEIKFQILNSKFQIPVFTTRADTLFGCTYLVLAPEHKIVSFLFSQISNLKEVKDYIEKAKKKTEMERILEVKEKTGVKLEKIKALNPVNQKEIPIFLADYVLVHYGTGAIMAVPAHDQRDFDFAKKYNLPIVEVIRPSKAINSESQINRAFEGEGILINSGKFSGMNSQKAREKIGEWLAEKKLAKRAVYYKIQDWVFSRQRYWGEPFPLVFCKNCAKKIKNQKSKVKSQFNKGELLNPGWIALPEKDLPLELPKVKNYQPTGTGESPLANIKKWVKTKCPKCKGKAKRETNTMPQWAGSCWYYLRYIDPQNDKELVNKKKERYWLQPRGVDLYVGGAEHATRHLIYARFWHKFLKDIGVVSTLEPFYKLFHVGLILGEDGRKMSKRWKNVINPDEVIKRYGADTLRLYEMFMGPFSQNIAWQTKGLIGMHRFLQRVWKFFTKNQKSKIKDQKEIQNSKLERLIHQTIKKVTKDIENFKFNTAISALMVLVNYFGKNKEKLTVNNLKTLLLLLSPFCPHLTEELWQRKIKNQKSKVKKKFKSIFQERWPKYDPRLTKEEKITLIIQINGKVRDKIEVEADISEKEAKELALAQEKIKKWLKEKSIKKTIFVPKKLINFVI
jgi:leucyl-tRNA synthetase